MEEAEKLASSVLSDKIAACANILPGMTSMYEWDGSMQKEQETLLLLKCKTKNKDLLEKRLSELHSYECPCILSFKPESINSSFSNWINES